MTAQPVEAPQDAPLVASASGGRTRSGAARLDAIDMLRGLVIVIMALDHVRGYMHASGLGDPLDLDTTNPALFATRWITHFCAPTFVFLAGVSAWLLVERGRTGWTLSRFLLTRGLWLIVLELTIINLGWQFAPSVLFLQVIWAIGISMIVLALLSCLPANAVLGIGLLIVVGHNALDPLTPGDMGGFGLVWHALHERGFDFVGPFPTIFAYPVLPWIGVMLTGYGFGRVFALPQARRRRILTATGLGMIAAFVILRALDVYGDPGGWQVQDAAWKTLGDFIDVQKYPPSLLFVLATLGPAIALLPWLDRMKGPLPAFLLPFGRAPLFAYVLHIFVVHGLAVLAAVATGFPAEALINPWFAPTPALEGWGLPLPAVYALWLLVVALLYVPVRWFAGVKARRRDWWLGYL